MRATCSRAIRDTHPTHGLAGGFEVRVCSQPCLGKSDGWESKCCQRPSKAVPSRCATPQQLVTAALPPGKGSSHTARVLPGPGWCVCVPVIPGRGDAPGCAGKEAPVFRQEHPHVSAARPQVPLVRCGAARHAAVPGRETRPHSAWYGLRSSPNLAAPTRGFDTL